MSNQFEEFGDSVVFYQFDYEFDEQKCLAKFPKAKVIINITTKDWKKKPNVGVIKHILSLNYQGILLLTFKDSEYMYNNYNNKLYATHLIQVFRNGFIYFAHMFDNQYNQDLNAYQKKCMEVAINNMQRDLLYLKYCNNCSYFAYNSIISCAVNPFRLFDNNMCKDFEKSKI
jgi:hypothetical protein